MPGSEHEILGDLFRERPAFAAELLSDQLGLKLPPFDEARCESVDFSDVIPTTYTADAAIALVYQRGAVVPAQRGVKADRPRQMPSSAVLGIVVEVQRHKRKQKRRSWPVYVTTLAARLECPVVLLVIATTAAVARWAAEPILVGEPDFILRPMVRPRTSSRS